MWLGLDVEARLAVGDGELVEDVACVEARKAVDKGGDLELVFKEALGCAFPYTLINHLDEGECHLVFDL